MSELREARGKLEYWLDQTASLHPNDYRRELDAVIDAAAPEINRLRAKLNKAVAALKANESDIRHEAAMLISMHPNRGTMKITSERLVSAADYMRDVLAELREGEQTAVRFVEW